MWVSDLRVMCHLFYNKRNYIPLTLKQGLMFSFYWIFAFWRQNRFFVSCYYQLNHILPDLHLLNRHLVHITSHWSVVCRLLSQFSIHKNWAYSLLWKLRVSEWNVSFCSMRSDIYNIRQHGVNLKIYGHDTAQFKCFIQYRYIFLTKAINIAKWHI